MRRMIAAIVSTGVLASIMMLTLPAQAAPGIVSRSGSALILNGAPYRFVGFNAFGVTGCEGEPWTRRQMDEYFAQLRPASVTRTWAFSRYGVSVLDQLVASATAAGQKLDLVLENDLADCTSTGAKTTAWYAGGYQSAFLGWARSVAARYVSSPAVAWYEPVNEPGQAQGEGSLPGDTMRAFYQAVATVIKTADPGRLVAAGDNLDTNYHADGYRTAASAPGLDILSLHDYESDFVQGAPATSSHFANTHQAAVANGKPIIIGEMNDSGCGLPKETRAANVTASIAAYLAAGAAGALVWNRSQSYYADCPTDDYVIAGSDPMINAVKTVRLPS